MARGRVPKKRKVEQAFNAPEEGLQESGSTTMFKQDPDIKNDYDQEEPPAMPLNDQTDCLVENERLDVAGYY